jgi:heme O synthase-like polyprenyltransferase
MRWSQQHWRWSGLGLAVRLLRSTSGSLVPCRGAPARRRVAAGGAQAPMRLFHLSIAYLTLLFAAIAVAALLPWGR